LVYRIGIQKIPVGPNSDDELQDRINDCSKFSFGFGYFIVSLRQRRHVALAVVDAGQHVPAADMTLGVS
jgi:hypothetical protein